MLLLLSIARCSLGSYNRNVNSRTGSSTYLLLPYFRIRDYTYSLSACYAQAWFVLKTPKYFGIMNSQRIIGRAPNFNFMYIRFGIISDLKITCVLSAQSMYLSSHPSRRHVFSRYCHC